MPGGIVSLPKLRKERAWRWKTRYRPTRILRVIVAAIWPSHKLSGSINLLPPELLHAIFELLAFSDHNTLSSCMRVCTRWHDIARLHFFAVVPACSYHRGPLSQLLCADPGLALYVKHVRFIGITESEDAWCKTCHQLSRAPFDVQSLASTLPVLGLTNLRYLSLVCYDLNIIHPPLLCQRPALWQRPPVRVSLQQLSFDSCLGVTRVLPDLLSLFSVHTLVIRIKSSIVQPSQRRPSPIHPSTPLASFAIQDLVLDIYMTHDLEEYYQFFRSTLVPGSLRALGIKVCTAQDFTKLGQFLRSSAAQDLRSISIDISPLLLFGYEADTTSTMYVNGVGTVFSALGAAIAHCTRLQCFRIRFTCHINHRSDPVSHRKTFEPIIANLPPTLRAFAIHIGVIYTWQSGKRKFCDGALGLHVVDRLLSAPSGAGGRFPHLQRVELHILEEVRSSASNKLIKELRPTPFPRLKAAGLLQATAVSEIGVRARFSREKSENAEIHDLGSRPMYWSEFGSITFRTYPRVRMKLNQEHTASFPRERRESSPDAEFMFPLQSNTLPGKFCFSCTP